MFLSRNSASFCFIGLTTSMSSVSATYRRLLGDVVSSACEWEACLVLWRVLRSSALLDAAAFQGGLSTVQNGSAPTHVQNVEELTAHQQSYPFQIRDLPSNHSTTLFRSLTLTNLTVRPLARACRVYSGCIVEQPGEVGIPYLVRGNGS